MEFNSLIKWVQPHFNEKQFYNGMISELEKKTPNLYGISHEIVKIAFNNRNEFQCWNKLRSEWKNVDFQGKFKSNSMWNGK